MFEINDDANAEPRDTEVIEHFAAFNIGDLVDYLRVHHHGAEGDEIRKIRTAVVVSEDAIGRLRLKIVVPITEWKPR